MEINMHDSSSIHPSTPHLLDHDQDLDREHEHDLSHVVHADLNDLGEEHDYALDPTLDDITTAEIISASIRANVAAQEAEEQARAALAAAAAAAAEAAAEAAVSNAVDDLAMHGDAAGVGAYGGHMLGDTRGMDIDAGGGEKALSCQVHLDAHTHTHAHTPLDDPSTVALTLDGSTATVNAIAGPSSHADLQAALSNAHAHVQAHALAQDQASANAQGSSSSSGSGTSNNSTHTDMLAYYGRPVRDDSTPHPEPVDFGSWAEFQVWLDNEMAWCHFIQRRITNPQKRAEERAKARDLKWKAVYDSMSPLERASCPAPLRRKRARTSTVAQKLTYTCHHSGTYTTKHSDRVPEDKLRMNTKKSVKCGCTSRIVVNEMESGAVHVAYHWRHTGHDPFATDEMETSRLPRVVDEWVVAQITAGKSPEEIRALLNVTEEEKAEYLRRETEISASGGEADPDVPPALAFALKIKYADIYNRYRKLHGTLRGSIRVQGSGVEGGDEDGDGQEGGGIEGQPALDAESGEVARQGQEDEMEEKASTGGTPPLNTIPLQNTTLAFDHDINQTSSTAGASAAATILSMPMPASLAAAGAVGGIGVGVSGAATLHSTTTHTHGEMDVSPFAPVNDGVIDWHLSDDEGGTTHASNMQADEMHAIDPIFCSAAAAELSMSVSGSGHGQGERYELKRPVFSLDAVAAGVKRSRDDVEVEIDPELDQQQQQQPAAPTVQSYSKRPKVSVTRNPSDSGSSSMVASLPEPQSRSLPATAASLVARVEDDLPGVGVGVGVGVGASASASRKRTPDSANANANPGANLQPGQDAEPGDTSHPDGDHNQYEDVKHEDGPGNGDEAEAENDNDTADAYGLESYFGDQAAMSELQMLANEIREHWRQ